MPYGNTSYTRDTIRQLLLHDDGLYMGNNAPAPHAYGLHAAATGLQMLNRVGHQQAGRTSRFMSVDEMVEALYTIINGQRATLLVPFDGGANSTSGTFDLPFTVEKFVAEPAPNNANPNLIQIVNGMPVLFDVRQTNRVFVMLRRTPQDDHYAVIQTCYPA